MKFPTYEEMAKDVAEKALDEYIYQGKTLREWVQIISENQDSDCISRKEAVHALRQAMYDYEDETEAQFINSKELDAGDWYEHRIFVQNMNDIDVQTINNLPSVIPKPKEGHWIPVMNGRGGHKCDVCNDYAPSFQIGTEYLSHYCPYCGAKMEVENG